jgi:hypothetical protein
VSKEPLSNPNGRYWDDLVQDFGLTAEEQEAVRSGTDRMIAGARAHRLTVAERRTRAVAMLQHVQERMRGVTGVD